jgi:hypothetical protein
VEVGSPWQGPETTGPSGEKRWAVASLAR